jgi:hypothetical protein
VGVGDDPVGLGLGVCLGSTDARLLLGEREDLLDPGPEAGEGRLAVGVRAAARPLVIHNAG